MGPRRTHVHERQLGRFGVELEAIRMDPDYIQQRPGPSRDRMLGAVLANIQLASAVGVKYITYHWTVIPIRRNDHRPGRGGSTYTGFKLEDHWQDLPVGEAGKAAAEEYWERISYFLEKAVPVAKQSNVRLACHPYDPPGLPLGYQGADNCDSPDIFAAPKRYESLVDSPYNGFQLCLGTTAEGLRDPRHEVLPIVQYPGERGKIYQITCGTSAVAATISPKSTPMKARWISSSSCASCATPISPDLSSPITCLTILTIPEGSRPMHSVTATSKRSFRP